MGKLESLIILIHDKLTQLPNQVVVHLDSIRMEGTNSRAVEPVYRRFAVERRRGRVRNSTACALLAKSSDFYSLFHVTTACFRLYCWMFIHDTSDESI